MQEIRKPTVEEPTHKPTFFDKADSFLERHTTRIILALCLIAAFRLFIFTAAFPFFNNVDEQAHYDTVYKYSQCYMPQDLQFFSPGSCRLILFYGTPEYFYKPEDFPNGQIRPPVWQLPQDKIALPLEAAIESYQQSTNHESGQMPLYYALAGGWYRLGTATGLDSGRALYWIRFLNILIYIGMVYLSYIFAKRLYPGNLYLSLGVPLLLAFFPQDVYYSINNDVPSALLFGLGFYGLMEIYLSESRGYFFHVLTGLAIAAAMLTKLGNIPILAITAVIIFAKLRKSGQLRREMLKMGVMLLAAIVPVAALFIRNYSVSGHVTDASEQAQILGWTVKPLGDMFHHPILTPHGALYFLNELMKTFWRGEFVWHLERITSAGMDFFYSISSAVFLITACVGLYIYRKKLFEKERFTGAMSLLVFGISVLMLAVLSMRYDFGECPFPSRELPYFTTGRLISGTLIPFLVLYLNGLGLLLKKWKTASSKLAIVLVIVIGITTSEILQTQPVFRSLYNWYHLP